MVKLGYGCSCTDSTKIEPQHSISALEHLKGGNDFDLIFNYAGWEEKGDRCGKVVSIESCPNHPENAKYIVHRCFDPKCEFCYPSWIGRQVGETEERLLKAKSLYEEQGHNLGNIKHIMVSPTQTDYIKELTKTKKGITKLFKICVDYLRRLGSKGGSYYFHLHRINEKYQKKFAVYKKNGGDGGIWDWVRTEDLWNKALYISPHFHVLQFGYLKDSDLAYQDFINNKRTNRFDGWIYEHIEPDVEEGRDLKRTIAYILNHSSLGYKNIYERRVLEVTRYFGMASKNKIVKDKEKSIVVKDYPECDICEHPIHKYIDKERDAIFIPKVVEENPESLFIFCNLFDTGNVVEIKRIDEYKIRTGSWYYRWRKKKRKVKKDGTVIHNGMVLEHFIPKGGN